MYNFIKSTAAEFKISNFTVVKMDVFRFIEQCDEKFDFIFAGPPYALTTIDDLPVKIFEKKLLNKKGWFVLEHTPRNNYKDQPHFYEERIYGTTVFTIFIES